MSPATPGQPIHVPPRPRSTGARALTSPPAERVTIHSFVPARSRAKGSRLETKISRFIVEESSKSQISYIVTTEMNDRGMVAFVMLYVFHLLLWSFHNLIE